MRISTGNSDSIFFLRVTAFFNLKNLAKMKDTTETVCQRNCSETVEHLCNIDVMKDIMCRCAYPQEILISMFFGVLSFFELRYLPKMKVCLCNSSETAQQNSWNFVINKDILWRCAWHNILIWFLLRIFILKVATLQKFYHLVWNNFSHGMVHVLYLIDTRVLI